MNVNPRRSGDGKGYTVSFSADSFSLNLPPSERPPSPPATGSKAKAKTTTAAGAAS